MEKQEKRVLTLDRYEHGVVINVLNEMRNDLLEEERPTDIVDEVLLKAIDAPTKKVRCRSDEAREYPPYPLPVRDSPCRVAWAFDRPLRTRRLARNCCPVSCGDERPVQNRALRGQPKNCPRFALCLWVGYRDFFIFPPQLPQGRRTRLGTLGQCQSREQKIPGSQAGGK